MPADTGRTDDRPGQKDTKGYTGLEGLLNYAYYQSGSINQFDQIGHLLHFSLYYINTGPCGHFDSGHDPESGEPGVPSQDGGDDHQHPRRRRLRRLARPEPAGDQRKPRPAAVRPVGLPERHRSRSGRRRNSARRPAPTTVTVATVAGAPARARARTGAQAIPGPTSPAAMPAAATKADRPDGGDTGLDLPGEIPDDILDDILDLPPGAIEDLPQSVQDQLGLGGGGQSGSPSGGGAGTAADATEDLLDFLFTGP